MIPSNHSFSSYIKSHRLTSFKENRKKLQLTIHFLEYLIVHAINITMVQNHILLSFSSSLNGIPNGLATFTIFLMSCPSSTPTEWLSQWGNRLLLQLRNYSRRCMFILRFHLEMSQILVLQIKVSKLACVESRKTYLFVGNNC